MLIRTLACVFSVVSLAANPLQAQDRRTAAPLPDGARGPAIPQDKGYLVEEIGEGLYWVTEGAYQVMFLATGEGVIVVDAPPTIGNKLLSAIAEVTNEQVTHIIYSHSHADHIGADVHQQVFSDGVEVTHVLAHQRRDLPQRPVSRTATVVILFAQPHPDEFPMQQKGLQGGGHLADAVALGHRYLAPIEVTESRTRPL